MINGNEMNFFVKEMCEYIQNLATAQISRRKQENRSNLGDISGCGDDRAAKETAMMLIVYQHAFQEHCARMVKANLAILPVLNQYLWPEGDVHCFQVSWSLAGGSK